MTVLLRYMWADVLKMKRTPLIWMHAAAPVLCAGFFLLYMMYGRIQEPYVLYSVFFSAIAVLYPFIISIVCGMSASVEEQAGHFQMMLAVPHSKIVSFAGKLLLLLLLNVLSIGLAICLYLAGMKFVLHINDLPYLLFLKGGAWLIAGSIPLYMMSFFVGIKYGMGPSGLLGGAGLLMAALMNTGLGDIIWRFFPWAWSVRLSGLAGLLHFDKVKKEFLPYVRYDMRYGEIMLYFSIVILCLAGLYWCRKWEGRRSYE
ncbi:lantibiotic immunity ABC transporter MutG family permease subunit [Bacillus velezensis]|uniref:lantibiotic immunity ABC transporter MutG family permease subunit n=1 Tax=Bacillus velezensis TaxID=492670 RepID=UPI003862611A